MQCFAVRRGEVANSRCDVDFHHPEYANLIRQIEALPNTALVSEIIASPLISGFAAGKDNRAQSGEDSVPQIRPTQILPDGEIDLSGAYGIGVQNISERDYLQYGEVLFNNTNSTSLVGKSAVFREHISAVCSNHVTRLLVKDDIEPEFVEMVLNMLQHRGGTSPDSVQTLTTKPASTQQRYRPSECLSRLNRNAKNWLQRWTPLVRIARQS